MFFLVLSQFEFSLFFSEKRRKKKRRKKVFIPKKSCGTNSFWPLLSLLSLLHIVWKVVRFELPFDSLMVESIN